MTTWGPRSSGWRRVGNDNDDGGCGGGGDGGGRGEVGSEAGVVVCAREQVRVLAIHDVAHGMD